MKKITLKAICVFTFIASFPQLFAQVACDGTLPFEEKNGLLTIEMESGNLPAGSDWKMGSEADPNVPGETVNYIFWDGAESFSTLTGSPITYNIIINTTGTYRLVWRGRIGKGDSGGEHNDAWVRVVADDFFSTKNNNPTGAEELEPKPNCTNNPDRECPEGASTNGYFKAFMNRHPINSTPENRWGFVTNTNDGNSFRFIWATFNNPGNYSIIVDARSNSFFMDKMVLTKSPVPGDGTNPDPFNLSNPESSCVDVLSTSDRQKALDVKAFPIPAYNQIEISNLPNQNGTLLLQNINGITVREVNYNSNKETINISDLQGGIYFISNTDKSNYFVKKIIKL